MGHIESVRHFTRGIHPGALFPVPAVPREKYRKLSAELVLEESLELISALGYKVTCGLKLKKSGRCDGVVAVAKECADVRVVTTQAMCFFGLPIEQVQAAVDLNNLTKLGGPKRADGKQLKPLDYVPVDLSFLE